jgi:hypothetical protein
MTPRALFPITAPDVELVLEDSAVLASVLIGAPVILLGAERDSWKGLPDQREMGLELCLLDSFGPALYHRNSAILDEFLGHGMT